MMLFSSSKKSNLAPAGRRDHDPISSSSISNIPSNAVAVSFKASRSSYASTPSTTTTMLSQAIMPLPEGQSKEELEKFANECTVAAYDLVWGHPSDYKQALVILHKALDVQRSFHGKHHKDVGYTCNFIATAYYLQGQDLNAAMRYFLEARRIFCKTVADNLLTTSPSSPSFGRICTTSPLLSGIDDRIHCILLRFQLSPDDIERAKQAIDRTIAHELQGDRLKAQGLIQASKDEYRRARKVAGVLRQLM